MRACGSQSLHVTTCFHTGDRQLARCDGHRSSRPRLSHPGLGWPVVAEALLCAIGPSGAAVAHMPADVPAHTDTLPHARALLCPVLS